MVPVVVRVNYGGEVDLAGRDVIFEDGANFGGVRGVNDDGIVGVVVGDQVGIVVGAANPWT
jgi:hypothetical protein